MSKPSAARAYDSLSLEHLLGQFFGSVAQLDPSNTRKAAEAVMERLQQRGWKPPKNAPTATVNEWKGSSHTTGALTERHSSHEGGQK